MGVRRDYRTLTPEQRQRFVAALKKVKDSDFIDDFAEMHKHHFNMNIHRSSHFLPWHREMLIRFENELRRHDPSVDLPYWDSSVDQSPTSLLWSHSFLGQFNSAWKLKRALGASPDLPTPPQVAANRTRSTYDSFWRELEDPIHRLPHQWVGGKMAVEDSPRDPVFYLHHAWIDMLWAKWQAAHPDAPFVESPPGKRAGLNDPLMEWPDRTPAHVLDHHALGYAYDTEPVPTGTPATGDDMTGGEALTPGQSITSRNGRYHLTYQSDGNLVLYAPWGWLWDSSTGQVVGVCLMQHDGNLVLRGPGGLYVWDSATDGNPGARLVVKDDGNLVILRSDGAQIWASGTQLPVGPTPSGDTMTAGQVLLPGQSIASANGRHRLINQEDGNLVLYTPQGAVWASNTAGTIPGGLVMQHDGNLVIYRPGGHFAWDSATDGNTYARLVVQDDGNAVIYRPDGEPIWATDTSG